MPDKKQPKKDKAKEVIAAYKNTPTQFDPQGSYTGTGKNKKTEKPIQDADDL